jgi:hypothetical protein
MKPRVEALAAGEGLTQRQKDTKKESAFSILHFSFRIFHFAFSTLQSAAFQAPLPKNGNAK